MKRNSLLVLSFLSSALLAACSGGDAISSSSINGGTLANSEFASVINSLKGTSHQAHIVYDIYVNQVSEDAVDGYVGNVSDRTFSYSKDGERAYKIKSVMYAADLVKGTHDKEKDSEGNELITSYDNGENLYFKDAETGVVIAEYLDVTNTVTTYIQSDYDYTSGIYTPIIFDDEFRNPFDFIQPRDLSKIENNKYTLSLDKASFALECYGSVASMAVTGCTITTNDNLQITNMHFDMGVEGGEGFTYTRTTSFDVDYSAFGEASVLQHVTPCTNSNPKLANALMSLKDVNSYKYSKDYVDAEGNVSDHIVGYFTQDAAFYHHNDKPDDTVVYSRGDDYDYAAVKCAANNKYYGYEYNYDSRTETYTPDLIMLSVSAAYSIDSFSGLGPNFAVVSPSIFSLKEGTQNVYTIEDKTILKSIASYFDYQFLGVNSQVLETRTSEFELTLEDDGSMTINTGYAYSESGKKVEQKIVYKLDVNTFNNTTIPSYVDIPDTTGVDKW